MLTAIIYGALPLVQTRPAVPKKSDCRGKKDGRRLSEGLPEMRKKLKRVKGGGGLREGKETETGEGGGGG